MIDINKIKQYIIGIAIIIVMFLLIGWLKDKIIVALGGYTTQTTTTIIDSTFVKGKVDTLKVFHSYVKAKGIILNPKPEIVYIPVNKDKEEVDSLKRFTVSIKDTLIEGKLTIFNTFKGGLVSTNLEYKPLFPKYIKSTDTVYINKVITKVLTNERSLIGVGVGYNNLQYLSILGSYTTKKNLQIVGEYGKSLNNTIEVIQGVPFEVKDSDFFSIKLIKHF